MPELTSMRFGYRGFQNKFRRSALDSWDVEWPESKSHIDFKAACLLAAENILEQKNPAILYSGGIDSEVALLSLLAVGAKPEIFTIRLAGNLNEPDLKWVETFRAKHRLEIQFVDIDLEELVRTGDALRIARAYQASHLEFCASLAAMEKLSDKFLIVGSGEPYLIRRKISPLADPAWFLCERENAFCWSKFLGTSAGGGARFFHSNGEILGAFLRSPEMQNIISGNDFGKASSISIKQAIFQRCFGLDNRPKFTGFEKAQALCRQFQFEVRREVGNFSANALRIHRTINEEGLANA